MPNIQAQAGTGEADAFDFTSTYLRTYRIPLDGLCDDGVDPTDISHVALEFLNESGSMLIDELAFEWSPDEADVLACDGTLVEGSDPNEDDEGSEDTGGTDGGETGGGGADAGNGCVCTADVHRRYPGGVLTLIISVAVFRRKRRRPHASQ